MLFVKSSGEKSLMNRGMSSIEAFRSGPSSVEAVRRGEIGFAYDSFQVYSYNRVEDLEQFIIVPCF